MTTKKYKVELKSLKIASNLSEETIAFTANIYVDGKKVGWAKNGGYGGGTEYRLEGADLREAVEGWAKTLPDRVSSFNGGDGKPFTYPMDFEAVIDDIVYKKDAENFRKKEINSFNRKQKTKTFVRVLNEDFDAGEFYSWKFPATDARLIEYLDKTYGADGYVILTDLADVEKAHVAIK